MTTIGGTPTRVDVDAHAHTAVDFTVGVLDGDGVPVTSLQGWSVAATATPPNLSAVPLTVVIDGGTVRVTATPAQTAAWFDTWPAHRAPYDVVLTDPDGTPLDPLCAGWWRIYPTHTR